MNNQVRTIFQNTTLISTLVGTGKFEEANKVKHETSNMLQGLIRSNKVKYNEYWLEVHKAIQSVDIDTTELEIALSFTQ